MQCSVICLEASGYLLPSSRCSGALSRLMSPLHCLSSLYYVLCSQFSVFCISTSSYSPVLTSPVSPLSLNTMSSPGTQATEAQGSPQSAGGFLEPPSYFYMEYGASFGFFRHSNWYLTSFPCRSRCWVYRSNCDM